MSGSAPQSSSGRQLSFSPVAIEQNGQLQRPLVETPQIQPTGQQRGGWMERAARNIVQAQSTLPVSGGAPITATDPFLAQVMGDLDKAIAAAKQKKEMAVRAFMTGG